MASRNQLNRLIPNRLLLNRLLCNFSLWPTHNNPLKHPSAAKRDGRGGTPNRSAFRLPKCNPQSIHSPLVYVSQRAYAQASHLPRTHRPRPGPAQAHAARRARRLEAQAPPRRSAPPPRRLHARPRARAGADQVRPHGRIALRILSRGRACDGLRSLPRPQHRNPHSSSAATRTSATSVPSPRPTAAWSSTSTTSTRPFAALSSGTSSAWPSASCSPDARQARSRASAAMPRAPSSRVTAA